MAASPFFAAANFLENTEGTKVHRMGSFGAREPEEKVFGGCEAALRSCSSLLTCSDAASLDSESDSFLWQRTTSTLKSEEDAACFAGVGSSMAMLQCEDTLDCDDDSPDGDVTREWLPGMQPASILGYSVYNHEDAEKTLGVELAKEQELGPHSAIPLPVQYRGVLVQWMHEVCCVRRLSQATFFSSVTLLDRFLRATGEGATPPTLLQLVALTCIAMAAKSEQQQCAAELLSLAADQNGNIYRPEDYRMMELHVFAVLQYRLRTPTIYTFACLFMHRVINRPQDGEVVPPGAAARFRALVVRLAELAAMDHELTGVPYSMLAVACLLIAETELKGGQLPANLKTVDSLRTVLGFPDMTGLSGPVQRLYVMYKTATDAAK